MTRFAVLILAAGLSSRMGQFKPLLTIHGETIINLLVSTFLKVGVEVHIVTGYRGNDIITAVKYGNITFVENPDYMNGMFTSVQAGTRSLKSEYSAFFIMPVDIPLVKVSSVQCLINTYIEHPGKIIYPTYHSKRGHPPLIPIGLTQAITEWNSHGNLREVLAAYEHLALEVEVKDKNILIDIDTIDDYRSIVDTPCNENPKTSV